MSEEKVSPAPTVEKQEVYLGNFIKLDVFLVDMFKAFKRLWWTVLLFVLLFCSAAYAMEKRSYVPLYSASASFTINSENTSSVASGASSYTTYYNAAVAEQLSKTFGYIINSETMRAILIRQIGPAAMNVSISARNNVEAAPIFTITVTGSDAQNAFDVLLAVIEHYPRLARFVIGESRMNIFSKAQLPTEPSNPFSCTRQLVLAAAAGILLGAAVMALYAFTRSTVRKREEIKTKLNLRCLVEVPQVRLKRRSRVKSKMVTIDDKHAGFSEAFRYLKRRTAMSLDKNHNKILAVTSVKPGEGKTTVSYNLALTFAQSGKRVALLDMDLMRKSLQQYLSPEQDVMGVSDIVYNNAPIERCVVKGKYGLDIYYAGSAKAPVYKREDFRALFNYIRRRYDYVILDTAPISLVADTAQVLNEADEVILVLRQDYTPVDRVLSGIGYISDINASLLGVVFNSVGEGFTGYSASYYGYYSTYGGYYGRKYGYYGRKYGYYGRKYGYSGRSGYGYGYGYSGKSRGYGYGYSGKNRGYGYGYKSAGKYISQQLGLNDKEEQNERED